MRYKIPKGYEKTAAGAGFYDPYFGDENDPKNPWNQGAAAAVPAEEPPPPPPASASEGVHPLAVSLEEGLFAIPQEQVIQLLQKLLRLKYTQVIAYMNYGDRIRAHFRDVIYAHFQEHMREEQKDAYDIAMKITALGGEPSPKVSSPPDLADLHMIFGAILEQEKQLIQAGRALAAVAGENLALKALAEQIVLTDAAHADDMRRMLFCEGPVA